jgi:uncharacterized membrane protein/mono/diheme cytochrome c family protein
VILSKNLAEAIGNLRRKRKAIRAQWVSALALSIFLALLPWIIRLNGHPHADWERFLGRFHPMAVHLPIGLLVLLPLLEITGKRRPALREAAGFVLELSFVSCLFALSLGFLLAYGSGIAGPGLSRHMAGGIALTIAVLACLLARPWWSNGHLLHLYPALLSCTLMLLVWAAHQGGSMTHGANYLTEYMPAALKRWIPQGAPPSASFYAKRINPVFDTNCVGCHGDSKIEGVLRLDSYDNLMKGGLHGPVIIPGNPDTSPLVQRVTLPPDHKGFMPAEGKPPLRGEEIAWIRAWIQQGASPSATTLAGISIRDHSKEQPPPPVPDYSSLMDEIRQLDQQQGAKLKPVSSKPEDGLILETVDAAPSFGDPQLAQFLKFAPYIVEAELARTAITDASFDTLAKFRSLRALHLEGTRITGNGLAKLSALSQLTYLNLSETQVTRASLAPLDSMKNLRHIYLFNTPAQPESSAANQQPTWNGK